MEKKMTKRGRKPKGGRIIKKKIEQNNIPEMFNIILHLQISKKEYDSWVLKNNFISDIKYSSTIENLEPYGNSMNCEDNFKILDNSLCNNENILINENKKDYVSNSKMEERENYKKIKDKLKELETKLYNNEIHKKSNCFWDHHSFQTPNIYLIKTIQESNYDVYGSFCSPECAISYLMNENIDNSLKLERLALFNSVYCEIFNYNKPFIPAPEPFYLLNSYFGNLTIDEFRKLHTTNRIHFIINKPITKIFPEIHSEINEVNILKKSNKFRLGRIKREKKNIFQFGK